MLLINSLRFLILFQISLVPLMWYLLIFHSPNYCNTTILHSCILYFQQFYALFFLFQAKFLYKQGFQDFTSLLGGPCRNTKIRVYYNSLQFVLHKVSNLRPVMTSTFGFQSLFSSYCVTMQFHNSTQYGHSLPISCIFTGEIRYIFETTCL